ncbi:SusC/RagA family TonB-linked outer membrane protein [Spirosoma sp. SC4-14]|uniref:SusC/RagA family TonB-linked outer membrane protein n=1 Tax=Spirosoma sp. SC4-14 TaxID=3128900 RepID=UPI0030D3AA4D
MVHSYTGILWRLVCYCLLLLPITGLAQIRLTGQVVEAGTKTPIAGATVLVKGTSQGSTTNADGYYSLNNVSPKATLSFSFIGFKTTEVEIKNQTVVNVELVEDSQQLQEVIVTALGISKQSKSLGYATQTIDSKQFTNSQDPNLVNNLAGRIAGVTITNGGAGVGSTSRIVIRGENSFSGTNQPLFVVDGVPINNETFFNNAINNSSNQGTWAEVDYGNGAAEINPQDIENITVLKGGTAAALYGSRAANGVVVLTTKRGKTEKGQVGVSFNTNTFIDTPLRTPRIQNQYGAGNGKQDYQFVDGGQSYENNIPNYGAPFDGRTVVQFDSPAGQFQAGDLVARAQNPGSTPTATPWVGHSDNFRNFLQTGVTTQNNLALNLNSEKGSLRISVGNLYNKGILPYTDLRRYTFAVRAENQLTDKLSSNMFLNYINSSSDNRPNIGYGSESVMYTFFGVYGMPININLQSLKDKWWQAGQEGVKQFRYWNNHDNPYVTLHENTNSFRKNRIIGNYSLKYSFSPNLNLMVRTGLDYYNDNREGHRAFSTVRFPTGGFRTDVVTYLENNTDFLLNYTKDFGKFGVNVSGGGNRFIQRLSYNSNIANSLITPGLYNFTNAQNTTLPLFQQQNKSIESAYMFGQFNYDEKVFLDVTGRNDWSSTLPAGQNSYFYPSAALSVIASDMVQLPQAISYLKLRASGASVGRDAVPYSVNNTYLTDTPFGSYPSVGANPVLANSKLKPSRTSTYELGFELRLLHNLIGLNTTYYNSLTKDEIVQLPIPISSGYTNAFVNGATIRNHGLEVILDVNPFKSQNGLNWNMTFNFARNISRVVSLPGGITTYKYAEITQYDRYYRSIQYNAVVGERLGNIYGRHYVRDPQGNIVYANGQAQTTGENERTLLGNYNPNFVLGWMNRLSYRNWTFNMLWDWRQGGVFYSYTMLGILNGGMSVETLPGRDSGGIVGNGVVKNADGTYAPNTVQATPANYYTSYYDPNNNEAFTFSASYVKLRELRVGYTFNRPLGWKGSASLSLIGRNLLLFTKNKDVDPENLSLRGTQILPGVEQLSLPSTRNLGVSLNVSF